MSEAGGGEDTGVGRMTDGGSWGERVEEHSNPESGTENVLNTTEATGSTMNDGSYGARSGSGTPEEEEDIGGIRNVEVIVVTTGAATTSTTARGTTSVPSEENRGTTTEPSTTPAGVNDVENSSPIQTGRGARPKEGPRPPPGGTPASEVHSTPLGSTQAQPHGGTTVRTGGDTMEEGTQREVGNINLGRLNKQWALELQGNFTQEELSSQLRIQSVVGKFLQGKEIKIQRVLINKDRKVILFLNDQISFNKASKRDTWGGMPQNVLPIPDTRLRTEFACVTGGISRHYDDEDIRKVLVSKGHHITKVETMTTRRETKMIRMYCPSLSALRDLMAPGALNDFEGTGRTYKVEHYKDRRFWRCRRCKRFGHEARSCPAQEEVCTFCAMGGHSSRVFEDCQAYWDRASMGTARLQCTNCGGNHAANDISCPDAKEWTESQRRHKYGKINPEGQQTRVQPRQGSGAQNQGATGIGNDMGVGNSGRDNAQLDVQREADESMRNQELLTDQVQNGAGTNTGFNGGRGRQYERTFPSLFSDRVKRGGRSQSQSRSRNRGRRASNRGGRGTTTTTMTIETPRNLVPEIQPSRPNQVTRVEPQEDRIEKLVKEVAELTSMMKNIVGFITSGGVIPWHNSPTSGHNSKAPPNNRDEDTERAMVDHGSRRQIRLQLRSQEEEPAPDETTDPLCLGLIHGAVTPVRSVEGSTDVGTETSEKHGGGGENMDTHEVTLTEVPQPPQPSTGERPLRPQGEGNNPNPSNSQSWVETQIIGPVNAASTAKTSGTSENTGAQAENRAYQGKLSKEPKVVPAKYGITVDKDLIRNDRILETDSHYLIPKGACTIFENNEEIGENNETENNPLLGTGTKKPTAPECQPQGRRLRSKVRAATPQHEESHGGQT